MGCAMRVIFMWVTCGSWEVTQNEGGYVTWMCDMKNDSENGV